MPARTPHAHHQVDLFGGTGVDRQGVPGVTGRNPRRRRSSRTRREAGLHLQREALVVHIAGGGDDEVARPVVVVEEAPDLTLVE